MSIAVMAADLFIGLPKILYGKITNKKIICFIENNKKMANRNSGRNSSSTVV